MQTVLKCNFHIDNDSHVQYQYSGLILVDFLGCVVKNVTIGRKASMKLCSVVLLPMFAASALPSFASEDEINIQDKQTKTKTVATSITKLDPIVVSATRRDVRTKDAPHSVYVQEADQLSHKQARNLPEALAQTPGVLVQKTANGHGSPFIRGFTGYRTLTLLDGIRYNNSVYRDGPNEYFSLIDLGSIESLTLLSGPSSVLYGSDSIGGTLYLLSKQSNYDLEEPGAFFTNGVLKYRYASGEESHIARTEVNVGVGDAWGLHLGYSRKAFGNVQAAELGELPHTGYDEENIDARLDVALSSRWTLTAAHQSTDQDDVWRTHSTIYSKSFSGTDIGSDLKRLKDQKRRLDYVKFTGVKVHPSVDELTLTLSQQNWQEDGDRIKGSGSRILQGFQSTMSGFDLQLTTNTPFAEFVYGIDYYLDEVDSHRTDYNPDGSVDRVRIQGPIGDDATYGQFGLFAQASVPLSNRLDLDIGGRYSYVKANIGKYEEPISGTAASYENNWSNFSSSIRVLYDLTGEDTDKIWAGLSQSFRAPNIADLSRYGKSRSTETEVAATDLSPETFLTYEIGYKKFSSHYDLTATYYYTEINDHITSTPTGRIVGGLTEVSKQNSAEGFVQGVELSGRYLLNDDFDVFGNLTWLESSLKNPVSGIFEPISRTMPFTTTAGVNWIPNDRYWLTASATYVEDADQLSEGDMSDGERIPPNGTPGYFLLNLYGTSQVTDTVQLNLALNNILDEAYRTHGSGSNEPGFGVTVGIEVTF